MFGAQSTFAFPSASTAPATSGQSGLFGGLFGSGAQTASNQTATSSNLFSTPATSGQAFGTSFGGFGVPATSFSFGGFKPTTTTAVATSQPAFGAAGNLFGTSSALPTTTMLGFGLQQPGVQQQQSILPGAQANISDLALFIASLKAPQIFGDERDHIIAKFNQLQAFCGIGKGFYSSSALPVDYTPSNPFCHFKAICYDRIDGSTDEEGLISLIMKRPEAEIKANLQMIIDDLFKMLGSKPQISVNFESTKPLPDNKTEMTFFVTETGITGTKRRILASESFSYFNQPTVRQQLANSLTVEQVLLKTLLPLDKMRDYLSIPQEGIDPLIWQQAVAENPDPKRLLPQPILGSQQLRERQKLQKTESDVHRSCLNELFKRLEKLEEQTLLKQSRLQELKSIEQRLSQRLLTVAGKYYVKIRRGYTFEMNEEVLKAKLDAVNAQLNGTAQLKNRLAEIASNAKLAAMPIKETNQREEPVDEDLLLEIRQYLKRCQNKIEDITTTVQDDQKNLATIARQSSA